MIQNTVWGILIPFIGTSAGAACVFFMRGQLNKLVERALMGFAAGVMVAASIWSLILPAMEQSANLGKLSFLPAVIGFWIGTLFLLLIDELTPHLHMFAIKPEGPQTHLSKTAMMLLAVTIHNIPEGMAVGVIYAGYLAHLNITAGAAMALSLGIAIQNFPEGAIISMPLHANGEGKVKSFIGGVLSGAVEPAGAVLMVFFSKYFSPLMPFLLSFAAGAMMYVVIEELVPEIASGEHTNTGAILFAFGFTLMMALDVALG